MSAPKFPSEIALSDKNQPLEEGAGSNGGEIELTPQQYADKVARLEALHKIGVAITSTLDNKALLQLVVDQAALLLEADSCSIALLDEDTGELVFMAAVDDIVGKRIPSGKGIMFRSLTKREAQIIHDVPSDPDHYSKTGEESNLIARSMLTVPLLSGEHPMGVLAAVNRREKHFSAQDRDLLVTMAGYVSIALENTRLFEQVQLHSRELELKVARRTSQLEKLYQRQSALAQVELAINQPHELEKVLNQICVSIRDILTTDGESAILLWDKETQTFTTSSTTYKKYSLEAIARRIKKKGISRAAIDSKKPILVSDIRETPFPPPNPILVEAGIKSIAAIPLISDKEVLGVLISMDRQYREFTKEDVDFLNSFSNRAANSIIKVRLYEAERRHRAKAESHAIAIQERERYLAILNDITRTAIEKQDMQVVLSTIAVRLKDLFNADGCYITFWDDEAGRTIPAASFGPSDQPYKQIAVPPNELTMTASVLKAGKALVAEDVSQSPYINPKIAAHFPTTSLLGLPLIVDQEKLGAVLLAYNDPSKISDKIISLAVQAAGQIALAIAKIQAIEVAQHRAKEAETLRQAGTAVTETLEKDEAINRILLQVKRVVPYDSASVQLIRKNELEIVGGHGWNNLHEIIGIRFPIPGDNPNTTVIQEKRPLILHSAPDEHAPFREKPHHQIQSWLGVPLIFRENVIGMLSLDSKQPNYFTSQHARLVAAFADQVAIAIENARLFETTKQIALEARIAQDILHRLNVVQDVVDAFPFVTEGLKDMTGCSRISLAMVDADRDWFVMVAMDEPYPELSRGTRMPVESTSAARDVLAGRAHLTPDLSLEADSPAEKLLFKAGHKSRINLPLRTPSEIIGSLNLTWKQTHGFKPEQLPLLMQIADAIALAVQKQRLLETERLRVKELEALRATVADISSELEMPKLHQIILDRAIELLNATSGEMGLVHEGNPEIYLAASSNMGRDEQDEGALHGVGDSILSDVLENGKAILIPDYRKWEKRLTKFVEGPWYGVIAAPISIRHHLLGVIALFDSRPARAFKLSDLELLKLFASQVAIAIDNAHLFQEVQIMATTDELTGINNRRQLFESGRLEFKKARRGKESFSAIMLDIDHFKRINDTYGHAAGDEILRGLANGCNQEIRKTDLFGRYGGEEFTILLPDTKLKDAQFLAERLRTRIAERPFKTNRGDINITISLGVANLTDDIPDLASLIDRADTALYTAKQAGRNRVETFEA